MKKKATLTEKRVREIVREELRRCGISASLERRLTKQKLQLERVFHRL